MNKETYLNKGIKEIIIEFPKVKNILEEYEIGCGKCAKGLCHLKDILNNNEINPEMEKKIMMKIMQIIASDTI
ncbi:MAG: hypothetical protein KGD63_11165 [Candidatus Lokiarchaeota archaeon]|nr:hypothetical protein [Candidatus Lokiarchaeota archaeon]